MNLTPCSPEEAKSVTDYSKPAHWLSLPGSIEKEIDVFYLYSTAWQKVDKEDPDICLINNLSMLKGAKAAFNRQATAFEEICNIYAPYYRQADGTYTLSLQPEKRDKVMEDIPKSDAVAAFDYYIRHFNHGRPFILASHSQGSTVMILLLSDYMKKNPIVYSRMIAAYVSGYSVTDKYLAENPHLKFAEGPDDTGVIISYNTEAPEVIAGSNPVVLPGANVINPITWTREETLATAGQSMGSFLPDQKGNYIKVINYADAMVDKARGVIICSTADADIYAAGNKVFGRGVFHPFDFSLYYYNIRENAATRTAEFLQK